MEGVRWVHSQSTYRAYLDEMVQPGCRWLDAGCGNSIIPLWMRDSLAFQKQLIARCSVACGCDPMDAREHVAGMQKQVGYCERLPYADASFDLVTANMVVEHVQEPELFASEINRVLARGGLFLMHTPNKLYPFIWIANLLPERTVRWVARWADGRMDEEIFPTYYRLNTKGAIQRLAGFCEAEIQYVGTLPLLAKIPVLSALESMVIRLAQRERFQWLRPNLIVLLEKKAS
jgi:ubiquinone/menaquinone biosynthesis C-methylase UbiE